TDHSQGIDRRAAGRWRGDLITVDIDLGQVPRVDVDHSAARRQIADDPLDRYGRMLRSRTAEQAELQAIMRVHSDLVELGAVEAVGELVLDEESVALLAVVERAAARVGQDDVGGAGDRAGDVPLVIEHATRGRRPGRELDDVERD